MASTPVTAPPGPARTRRPRLLLRRALLSVAVLTLAVLAALLVATLLARPGGPPMRLDADSGEMSLTGQAADARSVGLPADPVVGESYPVRLLLPPAEPGSRVTFAVLDVPGRLVPLDIALCPPSSTGAADVATCTLRDGSAVFAYAADGAREVPAVVSFGQEAVDPPLSVRALVHPPRTWWPFDDETPRLYVLASVTPRSG